jgi:hypothetical protein
MASGTLDANSETFSLEVKRGQIGTVAMGITGTITVTATFAAGAVSGVGFVKPDGNAAAWTASDVVELNAPGTYTFTATGVSGGSCQYEASTRPII